MAMRFLMSSLLLLSAACAVSARAAEEVTPVAGSLSLGDKNYPLTQIVAYETKSDDETFVTVLASDRKLPVPAIVAALREAKGSDEHLSLRQPYLKLIFNPTTGEIAGCTGSAGGTTFTTGSQDSEFKLNDGRAQGFATLSVTGEGNVKRSFDIRFDVPVGIDGVPKPLAKPNGPVKASVAGTFNGNNKNAKLEFISARPGEPFDDKPSIELILTEKDHSKDRRPEINAAFGRFGSALILRLHEDGSIFGCEVSHANLGGRTFSSVGSLETEDFEVLDGQVSGRLKTDGPVKTFDQTWEVDLKFTAPYTPPKSAAATPSAAKTPAAAKMAAPAATAKKAEAKPSAPGDSTAAINVHDFPFPSDVKDTEYKTLVEQLAFKSPSKVSVVAAGLQKRLAAQGWQVEPGGLVSAASAIIAVKRGEAELTIFVKPDGAGSTVLVMTEGLDWSEKEK